MNHDFAIMHEDGDGLSSYVGEWDVKGNDQNNVCSLHPSVCSSL